MQTRLTGVSLLLAVAASGAPSLAIADDTAVTACKTHSAEMLDAMRSGHYDRATRHFDAPMAAALPASKLGELWGTRLPASMGRFVSSGSPLARQRSGGAVVQTPLQFAHGDLLLQVSCQTDGSVAGLHFLPLTAATSPPTAAALPKGIRMLPESVPSPLGKLPAMLTLPAGKGPFPAVVLVAGSGPNDMDETIGPNKPLLDIALGLAEAGVATLRYDKRTHTYGAQLAGKPITVDQEVTDDALTALRTLRSLPQIDASRVFVLGHSLGALMAPRIAERDGHLAGAVLLAAPERLNLDLILRQMRYIDGLGGDQAMVKQIADVRVARDRLANADPKHPPQGMFFHAPAEYWLSLRDYDAIDTARTIRTPLLVLQGLADYQVGPDFARWQKAFDGSRRVSLHGYPGLSHLFMPAGKPPSPADYVHAGHVQPAVIGDIARWILARPAVR